MNRFLRRLVGRLLAVMICLAGSLPAVSQERHYAFPAAPASFTAPQGTETILLEYQTITGVDFEPRFEYFDSSCLPTDNTKPPSPHPFSLNVFDDSSGSQLGSVTGVTGPTLTFYECGCHFQSTYECEFDQFDDDVFVGTPGSREIDIRALTANGPAPITVTAEGIYALVTVAALRPATFAFHLSSNLPDQKILTHKYRTDDAYPLLTQLSVPVTARPQVRIEGVVNVDGSGVARQVWFRLIDPPDKSAYIPIPMKDRAPDNMDPDLLRGQLYAQDGQGNFLLNPDGTRLTSDDTGVLKTTSRAAGGITLVLEATDRYAGDNYQIEASFDEQFTCATAGVDGANDCVRSVVYVAWKRLYYEHGTMAKAGAFLARDVVGGTGPCSTQDPCEIRLRSVAVDGIDVVRPGARLTIIGTGGPINAPGTTPHSEVVTVDANSQTLGDAVSQVGPGHFAVRLTSRPVHSYVGGMNEPSFYDAVITTPDVYTADMNSVAAVLSDAFIEYVTAPDLTLVPYVGIMTPKSGAGLMRWMRYREATPPFKPQLNHRFVIGSDRFEVGSGCGTILGYRVDSTRYSYVLRGTIDRGGAGALGTFYPSNPGPRDQPESLPAGCAAWVLGIVGINPSDLLYGSTAHEIVHQFSVNPAVVGGHCSVATDYSGVYKCLMDVGYPQSAALGQLSNRILNLHIGPTGEYATMRAEQDTSQ